MADIDKVRRNIGKMIDQGAPEADIDAYLAAAGVSIDQLKSPPAPQPTLDERAQSVFGIDPKLKRGALLPLATNPEGGIEAALPQFGVDMAKSFLLPGHVMQGGAYTEKDVTRAALDFNPMARSPASRGLRPPTKRQFRKAAPSADMLKKRSTAFFKRADDMGIVVDSEALVSPMAKLEGKINKIGTSKTLHPTATGVWDEWTKRIGNDLSLNDIQIMRREAREVALKGGSEGLIGTKMIEAMDDFIDTLSKNNVISGEPVDVGKVLKQARSLWQRQSKVALMDEVFEKASNQASGFENGLRIGFRQILQNPKKRRGFTPDEIKAMKDVIGGGPVRQALRLLGKFGPRGTGQPQGLGTSIGMAGGAAAGSAAGGPIGAAVGSIGIPAVAHLATRGAARSTSNAAEFARALAAAGGKSPKLTTNVRKLMLRGLGPTVGTQLPQTHERGPNGGFIINGKEVF